MVDLKALAHRLDGAAVRAELTPQPDGSLSLQQAYEVQRTVVGARIARGARQVGIKMGFTSHAKMAQMGLSDMIWGRLTSDMIIADDATVDLARFIHPRVEPEVAYRLKTPLCGRVSLQEALAAVDAVAPALEIIDSRYRDFKFSLAAVVADNASSAGFVTGPWHRPEVDVSNLPLTLSFDGVPVQVGSTAEILGHPLNALVAAARFAEEAGEPLQPGWIIMAGGATAAEPLHAGVRVALEMQTLGCVGFDVGG